MKRPLPPSLSLAVDPGAGLASGARRRASFRAAPAAAVIAALSFGVLGDLVGPLNSAAAARPSRKSAAPANKSALRQAMAQFRAGDYVRALRLLETAPAGADAHNLRGAIFLRQRQFEQARQEFAAASLDPTLWEAAYNLAETDFQQGRYVESRRRFEALSARADSAREREFLRYKILLANLLAGREEPALRFLAEAQKKGERPPAFYFLHAALDRQHGRDAEADQWLTRAAAESVAPKHFEHAFVDSFRVLGWRVPKPGHASERAGAERRAAPSSTSNDAPARVAVVQVYPTRAQSEPPPTVAPAENTRPAPSPPVAFRLGPVPAVDGNAPPHPLETTAAEEFGGLPPRPPGTSGSGAFPSSSGQPVVMASPSPARGQPAAAGASGSPGAADRGAGAAAAVVPTPSPSPGATPRPTPPVPSDAFNAKYELAYRAYSQRDYPGALQFLDEADALQPGLADGANLRGLIYSRQRRYNESEEAFKKAIAADPTFWAAKFNLAELPFGYKNYTEARKRFEALFAETDRAAQPREAELTEFKVFLTLLLEGKESAARNFMTRFKSDGSTPARLYAQAAMDFHDGKFDKAIESINAAKKNYPAPLEAIFAESFYRVGWLTDNSAAAVAAAATPAPSPPAAPAVAEEKTSPALPAPASPAPAAVAAASPTPPGATEAAAAVSSPAAEPATPGPTPALATAPSAPPAGTGGTPAAFLLAETPEPADAARAARSPAERLVRGVLPFVVLLYIVGTLLYMFKIIFDRRRPKNRQDTRPASLSTSKMAENSKV